VISVKCCAVPTFEPEQPVVITCQSDADPDPQVLALETPGGVLRFVTFLCAFHKVATNFQVKSLDS
jgi:hypothetical protein